MWGSNLQPQYQESHALLTQPVRSPNNSIFYNKQSCKFQPPQSLSTLISISLAQQDCVALLRSCTGIQFQTESQGDSWVQFLCFPSLKDCSSASSCHQIFKNSCFICIVRFSSSLQPEGYSGTCYSVMSRNGSSQQLYCLLKTK